MRDLQIAALGEMEQRRREGAGRDLTLNEHARNGRWRIIGWSSPLGRRVRATPATNGNLEHEQEDE